MKFTLPIRTFLHMVKVVTEPSDDLLEVYDHTLRISAVGKELTLSSNRTEAGCEAEIAEEGVCFFQHGRLKRLLLEYMKTICIGMAPTKLLAKAANRYGGRNHAALDVDSESPRHLVGINDHDDRLAALPRKPCED